MILAQGLQRHLLGADWRWPDAAPAGSGGGAAPPPELARLLQLFWDTPAGACARLLLPSTNVTVPARVHVCALLPLAAYPAAAARANDSRTALHFFKAA